MKEILKGDNFLINDIEVEYVNGLGLRVTPLPRHDIEVNFIDFNMQQMEQLHQILTQILLLNNLTHK